MVTASTVFTVYVLNLHYRTPETHEMGSFVREMQYISFSSQTRNPHNFNTRPLSDKSSSIILAALDVKNEASWGEVHLRHFTSTFL